MPQKSPVDYRVNLHQEGYVLSIEITCCKTRIGEVRFQDGQMLTCPLCGTRHILRLQHNHFHLSQEHEIKTCS